MFLSYNKYLGFIMKIRLTIYVIFFLSLLCSLFSFFALSGTMLPYQDATQDMIIEQAKEIKFWEFSLLYSSLISLISGIVLWKIARKKKL